MPFYKYIVIYIRVSEFEFAGLCVAVVDEPGAQQLASLYPSPLLLTPRSRSSSHPPWSG